MRTLSRRGTRRDVECTERCGMTTNSEDELPRDPAILLAITNMNDLRLGV